MTNNNAMDPKKPDFLNAYPIAQILNNGVRKLAATALEAEIEIFINQNNELTDDNDRRRILRNGCLPGREIQTGIGQVWYFLHSFNGEINLRKANINH
jgi:putative transposase